MKKSLLQELVVDRAGLVWAYQFHDATTTELSHEDDLGERLSQHLVDPAGKLLWLHFNLSQASTERWLREHTPLPPEFFEALQQGSRSTRVEQVDDALLAVVNDVLHGFAFDPSETSTLWMYITPTLLISARKKPLKSVDRLRQAVQQGASVTSTTELLTHLLRDQADVLIGIVRDTVTRVDKIEDDPWSKPFSEDGFATAGSSIEEIASQLGGELIADSPICIHGHMLLKDGTSPTTGKAYRGHVCIEKVKANQCPAIWYNLSADGKWKVQE
jgi:Mg2+ and Co2+ transporter CorA